MHISGNGGTMPDPPRPVTQEHEIVGRFNPRCVRCQRTVIDLVLHPCACEPVPTNADDLGTR